jgi:signal transduction histidine kinase/phage shock protein PspC (stress-responsive transcriptional regulator)
VPGRASRPPLRRTGDDRLVAGVCAAVARHLGVDVWAVRSVFILLAFLHFAGLVGYACLWWLVPQDVEDELAGDASNAPAPTATTTVRETVERPWLGPLLGLGAAGIGLVILAARFGLDPVKGFTVPIVVVAVGVAVIWRVADDAQRERWRVAATVGSGRRAWIRIAVGVLLISGGVGIMLAIQGGISAALYGLAALAVVALGAFALAGPWLYRLGRDMRAERLERIRSQERAELAAHVHDSVLQTLTLVQRHADDPREVVRLARAEERALRGWLYDPERAAAGTFSPSIDRIAAEIEERYGGTVDVVVVGDAPVDEGLAATLQAAGEAIVNAAKYASQAGPVSVYAEITEREVAVFVRDRGPGFDVDAVPADRHGVRESVIGRMERHGGRATVRSSSDGTEVELIMPRETP